MSLLSTKGLSVDISGSRILDGIDISVATGETVGIIGPNGSGKTTFFNTLSGFLPASSGTITFNHKEIANEPPYRRAKLGIGRVFQNFGIFRDMSLVENLVCAIESREGVFSGFFPWSKKARVHREQALQYLSQINLQEKAHQRAANLSGGQMRLLEIIRTVAAGAELYLLDEPTAGVSPKMKDDVAAMITRLKEMNKTVLIIEHDINFIQRFCQRIIVLDVGRVVMDDTPENVRNNKQLQEIYFGS